ncbi:hypothetical protein AAKU67_004035 [Oxalobacteraceae bacterium GrIS 2.11]
MTKISATNPHPNKAAAGSNGLKVPHELDQLPSKDPIKPQPVMRQAYDDLEKGLVDTDMHGERGVEEVQKNSNQTDHKTDNKKKRSANSKK